MTKRRTFLLATGGTAAMAAFSLPARAQAFPSR